MNIHPSGCWNSLPLKKNKEHPILQSQYRGQSSPCQVSNKQGLTVRWAGPISTDRVEIVCSVPIHRNIARAGESYQKWCSSSNNFISNKYMKTSTYNTIALMITAMFTCTLLVATYQKKPRLIELADTISCGMRLVVFVCSALWKIKYTYRQVSNIRCTKSQH